MLFWDYQCEDDAAAVYEHKMFLIFMALTFIS